MQPDTHSYQIYNYSEIFSEYFFHDKAENSYLCPEHALIFVFSGKLTIYNGNIERTIHKGEYIFLRKDINTILIRETYDEETFSSVFMGFSHNFLYEFYRNMKKKETLRETTNPPENIIELPQNPYLESMYVSLSSYLQWNIRPMHQIVEIKLMEAILSLLLTNECFYTCLFDFPDSFVNNYIAINHNNCTILPVFKDCCQQAEVVNSTCTLSKKLEIIYVRLQQKNGATNIYMEASYKNKTKISQLIEKPYCYMPPN